MAKADVAVDAHHRASAVGAGIKLDAGRNGLELFAKFSHKGWHMGYDIILINVLVRLKPLTFVVHFQLTQKR